MKRCPDCGETKRPEEFYSVKLRRKAGIVPGLSSYCRVCTNQRAVEYDRMRYSSDPAYRERRNRQNAASEQRRRIDDPEYAKAMDWKSNQRRLESARRKKAQHLEENC